MRVLQISTLPLMLLFIVGCSPGKSADPPPPHPKTIFDPLTHQLDRAHEVQNTVDANTDKTRTAVDKQERGEDSP